MKLAFYGAARGVTGSNHYLEVGKTKLLIDCGMFQGSKSDKKMNFEPLPYNPAEIDYVLLTHAHIDHSGRIPLLYKRGYKGPVICTKPTGDLCEIMLPDSAHIQEMDAEYKNRKRLRSGDKPVEALYNTEDVAIALRYFKKAQYDQIIKINEEVTIRFKEAGHILGSAAIEIWCREEDKTTKMVFSGDLGKFDTPIIRDPALIEESDFLVMESTYGNKKHLHANNREELMFNIIEETLKKNGTVIIPSFAVGRTQEMIYGINKQVDLRDRFKAIKNVPVYVDSPLAISATDVFRNNINVFDKEAKDYIFNGDNPLDFENLIFTKTADESKAINMYKGAKIIISASGMCDAGRIKHHLKHNLWKENTTVLFVGYQAQGTLGRRLVEGADKVKIFRDIVEVKARIEMIDGFSGHGDMDDLDFYLAGFKKKPQKIFLVHGEDEQLEGFAERIKEKFNMNTTIPVYGQQYNLACGICSDETPEPLRIMNEMKFKRLGLLNLMKKVQGQAIDMNNLISKDLINTLKDDSIDKITESYDLIEEQIKTIVKTMETKND